MNTKLCTKCGIKLDADKFYGDKTKKDGLSSYCKDCSHMRRKLNKHNEKSLNFKPKKMEVKQCTKCELEKPVAEFKTLKNGKILNWCLECQKIYAPKPETIEELILKQELWEKGLQLCNKCNMPLEFDKFATTPTGKLSKSCVSCTREHNFNRSGRDLNKFLEKKTLLSRGVKKCSRCNTILPINEFKEGSCRCKSCIIAMRHKKNNTDVIKLERTIRNQKYMEQGLRECKKCSKVLPLIEFSKSNKGHYSPYCFNCNQELYYENKEKNLSPEQKMFNEGFKKCLACGEIFPITKQYWRSDLKLYRAGRCRKCDNRISRPREQQRRKQKRFETDEKYRKFVLLREQNRIKKAERRRQYELRQQEWALKREEQKEAKRKLIEYRQSPEFKAELAEKRLAARRRHDSSPRKKERYKERYNNDDVFASKQRLRHLIRNSFMRGGYPKEGRTEEILGCDYLTAKKHIESLFLEGMSWKNKNLWHIDHILPLAAAKTKEEVIALCHYTNLQPLWAEDNLKKGANQVPHAWVGRI